MNLEAIERVAETDMATGRVVIVGLGASGLSVARYLYAENRDIVVVDSRAQPPMLTQLRAELSDVPVHTGAFDARRLAGADMVVVSPGVSVREPAIVQAAARGAEIVGDVELFARVATAPVIAITGTNGKSTVTALVGEMCAAAGLDTAVGGNIGVPALDLLRTPEPDAYVLELSSFQLETTRSLNAKAAAVLNVSPDHFDRYRDLDDYIKAKTRIFRGDGVMVLNADDPRVMRMQAPRRKVVCFGLAAPASAHDYGVTVDRAGAQLLVRGERPLLAASELGLVGRHNVANVLAAMALAETMGVSREVASDVARRFRGLPHRSQTVATRQDVAWINDSKATNVGATLAAITGMDRPVVLIAGGDGKGADFAPLAAPVASHTRAVVLIGQDAARLEAVLPDTVKVVHAESLTAAVQRAAELAVAGDAVLLSPACASFDMFRDYQDRGEQFIAAVEALDA